MRYLTLDDVTVAGKRVLVRADLNVPLDGGEASDDFRLQAAVPTIRRLRDAGATTILASHLGRPDGRDASLRMAPVGRRLSEIGGFEVEQLDDVVGPAVDRAVADAESGDVLLLENTRFELGEKKNDPQLSRALASLADLFVLDAFGTAHRAHASTVGVADHIPSVAGPLLVAELEALSSLLDDPAHPFIVVLGGAKVSDKLAVIEALLPRVDSMLIGGGMCFTLLAATGKEIGSSLLEENMLETVRALLDAAEGDKIELPTDIIVADRFAEDAEPTLVSADEIPPGTIGLDIGPETAETFATRIAGAGSVFWNGPMGVFEWSAYRDGTASVAEAVAGTSGYSVVGGGDSVAAVRLLGVADDIDHVSTGGGAGLEFLEGKELPGLAALEKWV